MFIQYYKSRLNHILKYGIMPIITGMLVILGFSPFDVTFCTYLGIALLFGIITRAASPINCFKQTFLFGIGFYSLGIYWIFNSIYMYGNVNLPISIILTICLIMFFSIIQAIQGFFAKKIFFSTPGITNAITFAATWTIAEWFRGWFLSGFPWLFIGYTQTNSYLKPLAPIIGAWGLSFLVVFLSCLIFIGWYHKKNFKYLLTIFYTILIIYCIIPLINKSWTKPSSSTPVSVSLLQGNIPQQLKWDPNHVQNIISTYMDLTNKHLDKQLIIWPEAAFPVPIPYSNHFLEQLNDKANKNNTSLIIGIPEVSDSGESYNSITTLGKAQGHYQKVHLVLFGEFIPFQKLLEPLIKKTKINIGSNTHGPHNQANLKFDNIEIAPFICYEIAFADTLLDQRKNANLMLTLINDAWFGKSIASSQHLQIARFRSLQTGKYQLVCANDGITAIIDSFGNIIKSIPPYTTTSLEGEVYPMEGYTPWVIIGYKPIIAFCSIWSIALHLMFYRRKRTNLIQAPS